MFITSTIKTATAAAGTAVGFWFAGMVVAPEATANVVATLQDRFGMVFSVDCEARPSDCLKVKQRDLAMLAETLAALRGRLDGEQAKTIELATEASRKQATNRLYLEEGRRILNTALPGQAVAFLGVTYPSPDALRQQLEVTFAEGQHLEEIVAQYTTTRDEIANARAEIITRRAEVLGELAIIPSLITLVEVQTASGEVRAALEKVDGVMARAHTASRAADPLLRNTDELMADAARPPSTEFDAWLKGDIRKTN